MAVTLTSLTQQLASFKEYSKRGLQQGYSHSSCTYGIDALCQPKRGNLW